MSAGQTVELGRYAFRFEGAERVAGPELRRRPRHRRRARSDDEPLTRAASGEARLRQRRPGHDRSRDRPGLHARPVRRARRTARRRRLGACACYVKPFVRWIWLGALLMMLGGFVAATDRRFRVDVVATELGRSAAGGRDAHEACVSSLPLADRSPRSACCCRRRAAQPQPDRDALPSPLIGKPAPAFACRCCTNPAALRPQQRPARRSRTCSTSGAAGARTAATSIRC